MRIERVAVRRLRSFGRYENIEVEREAVLEEGDDASIVVAGLNLAVQADIDDAIAVKDVDDSDP